MVVAVTVARTDGEARFVARLVHGHTGWQVAGYSEELASGESGCFIGALP
jgi:hypothetical protein